MAVLYQPEYQLVQLYTALFLVLGYPEVTTWLLAYSIEGSSIKRCAAGIEAPPRDLFLMYGWCNTL